MYSTSDQNGGSEASSGIPRHNDVAGFLDVERAAIEKTLRQTGNSQHQTARILGISRSTLLLKINSYRARDASDRIHRLAQADPDSNGRRWPYEWDDI